MPTYFFKPAFVCAALAPLALIACKDENNRVISKQVSPLGHAFYLMPILEKGVSDITVSAAWATDWVATPGQNEWVPALAAQTMMAGGTAALPPADVLDLLEEKNTRGNIIPAAEIIYADVKFPNNHTDVVLPVLAELFQAPAFDTQWFERIKAQRIEAASVSQRPVAHDMWEAARFAIFGDGPLTEFLNGHDLEDLAAVSRADLQGWQEVSFDERPLALVVTGATDAAEAAKIVDTLLPTLGAAPAPKPLPQSAEYPAKPIYLHLPEAEKSTLGFLGPMPSAADGQDLVDLVAGHLFASGADSPLFEAVRSELGASYGMGMQFSNFTRESRVVTISGEVEGAKMAAVVSAVLESYSTFLNDPDTDQLADFTTRIADRIRDNQKFVSTSAEMIRELVLHGRDPQGYHDLADTTEALTATDIKARLTAAFPPADQLAVFAAGPDPSHLPGACVIVEPAQAVSCRGRP